MITMEQGFDAVRLHGSRRVYGWGYTPQDGRFRHACATCGTVFYRDHEYRYRHGQRWFCCYNHMREWERQKAAKALRFNFGHPAWQHTPNTVRQRIERCRLRISELDRELAGLPQGNRRHGVLANRRSWTDKLVYAQNVLREMEEGEGGTRE